MNRRAHADPFKGLLAGVAAGLIASLVMSQFQKAWTAAQQAASSGEGDEEGSKESDAGDGDSDEPATTKAADMAAEAVTGERVPQPWRKYADPAVHYATGAVLGGFYGAAAERAPGLTAGYGTAYGATVALGLDEAVVPLLGLGPAPEETPVGMHVYALVSHLVFGLALEGSRRLVRRLL